MFPADNYWNAPIDALPVHPSSSRWVASIGDTDLHPDFGGRQYGIPVTVTRQKPRTRVRFDYADESDQVRYPLRRSTRIEGGSDRHTVVVDSRRCRLYETWNTRLTDSGWRAGSGAVWNLRSNALRPAGWTSADAAGLPVFPGLVRYDEVVGRGEIRHALRFTVAVTRRAYVAPATHWASSDRGTNRPPMGMRVRLKASFDTSGFGPQTRVVLACLKRYGMFVADNGSNWYVSGAPDARWDDDDLNGLKSVPGSAFEVVRMGTVVHD